MPIRFWRLIAALSALLVAVGMSLVVASTANAARPFPGLRLSLAGDGPSGGWRWAERVDVYDASLVGSDNQLKLPQATREWSRGSGAELAMVSNSSDAEILVRTTNFDPCGIPGAVVCVYAPAVDNGIAHGQCQVQVADNWARAGVGEYLALHVIGQCLGLPHTTSKSVMNEVVRTKGYLTSPTSYDYRVMASLYGK